MISFDVAFDYLLPNEGGLTNDPNDAGGMTKYGISLRFLRACGLRYDFDKNGIVDESEINNLTLLQARLIYKNEFWCIEFEKINSQIIVNYIFDMWVNMGKKQAIRIVQRALWACGISRTVIKDDGILGPQTLTRINQISGTLLNVALRSERAAVYRLIVATHPENNVFLNGWLARAYEQKT